MIDRYSDIKTLTHSLFTYGRTAEGKAAMGYEMETVNLALGRWVKLQKDFFDIRAQKFDLSKAGVVLGLVRLQIPTLYDCIKFDCIHNADLPLKNRDELFMKSKVLADIIVPQEYGMYTWEKMLIGRNIVKNLLIKIDVVRERIQASSCIGFANLCVWSVQQVHREVRPLAGGEQL